MTLVTFAKKAAYAAVLSGLVISPALAVDPLHEVVGWIKNETGGPTHFADQFVVLPDGKLRGTRPPAVLAVEARHARDAGDCGMAVEWMIHGAEHDEGAKNVMRANPTATCALL